VIVHQENQRRTTRHRHNNNISRSLQEEETNIIQVGVVERERETIEMPSKSPKSNNINSNNPKSFRRMGSLGERARNFFSKYKKKNTFGEDSIEEEKHLHEHDVEDVVIVGAGIVGLVLALSLHTHAGITPKVYEQAPSFHDDVGAGMGMYPNGLRVIRDISPDLLKDVQDAGYPYLYRRWEVRRKLLQVRVVQ
jgi:hypothetical protein